MDSQSVRTTERGGAHGYDGAKKLSGRKHHLLVDTLWLVLGVLVHPADLQDRATAPWLLRYLQSSLPRLQLIWADAGYLGPQQTWVWETFGWHLQNRSCVYQAMRIPAEQEVLMADAVGNRKHESPKRRWDRNLKNVQQAAQKTAKRFAPLVMLWTKINNDGIFNASATLAYTFLVSIFPIFLVILAIAGFILGAIAPANFTTLENRLAGSLPGGSSGAGGQIVASVLHQLNHSAGILLVVGILGALIAGSGLFLTLESAFGIIFRLKTRDPIPQRIMAISMVLLYVVLVPIMVFASILPSVILKALQIGTHNPAGALLIQILGLVVAFGSGCLFFAAVYFVVPNRKMLARDVWKGTLAAALLLVMYELVFPLYESLFLHPNSYGSLVGFSIVILTFFYYLGFIVLLGAEINSLAMGLRPTTKPISAVLQELQERDLMIEPPGSSAVGTVPPPSP